LRLKDIILSPLQALTFFLFVAFEPVYQEPSKIFFLSFL